VLLTQSLLYISFMRISYFGTPSFAVPILESLYGNDNIKITSVVTQPDKPGNRNKITPPAVKIIAQELGLKIHQPDKIDAAFIEELEKESPDAIVVVAYGEIIPEELLDLPTFGCINVHPSLLPKYRGASPIQEAILNGDTETGVSIMKLDKELDHGPIILIKRVEIAEDENAEILSTKLAKIAAEILPMALQDIEDELLTPIPQEHNKATFCSKITKQEGEIDWKKTGKEILNQVRALNPWPSTYTILKGKRVKIPEIEITKEETPGKPGTIKNLDKDNFGFYSKDSLIIPKKLQVEGKSEMTTKEFLNGYKNLLD
jgi:methionyl-tRNA formyltransferase